MKAAADPAEPMAAPLRRRGLFWPAVRTVLLAALLAYAFRAFIAEPYSVPSASMAPTILPGDHLLVNKWAYGYNEHSLPFSALDRHFSLGAELPERGDVVVFADPRGGDLYFVKRAIGLPGDVVSGRGNGTIILNGKPVTLSDSDTGTLETLPGGRHYLVEDSVDKGPLDEFSEIAIPAGHIFVLGDNRDHSEDSRCGLDRGGFGLVPMDRLVGRAAYLILPAPTATGDRFARFGPIQ